MDSVVLANSDKIAEQLRDECYSLAFDSFLHGHNLLESRIFRREVAYCYLCKAWKLKSDEKFPKARKIQEFIDWIVQDFILDSVAFIFCIKLFAHQITLGAKKQGMTVLGRLDNQARDIILLRDFFDVCRENQNKDIVFVSLDKKLRKFAVWCSATYNNCNQIKLCISEHVFDGCNLNKKDIEIFISQLNKLEERSYPHDLLLRMDSIRNSLETDLLQSHSNNPS